MKSCTEIIRFIFKNLIHINIHYSLIYTEDTFWIRHVDHQRRLSMSNDWGPTRIRREWCDELANFEVTSRSQHLTWFTPSSYQGTTATLKPV